MAQAHEDNINEPKDFAPYLWWGILVVVLIMVGLILAMGKRAPGRSEVRVKHILITCDSRDPADRSRALELIQELRTRIEQGESFDKLAKEYSDDKSSGARGGDMGPMPKGQFQEQFENYAWSAPLNELSEIVLTTYGYHLIVVTERYLSEGDAYELELDRRVAEQGEKAEGAAPAETPAPAATPVAPVESAPVATPAPVPVVPAPAVTPEPAPAATPGS